MDRKRGQGEKRKQGVFTKGLDSAVAETGTKMDHCMPINGLHTDLSLSVISEERVNMGKM